MRAHWNVHRLLFGVAAVVAFAAVAASPALAGTRVAQHAKVRVHKRAHRHALSVVGIGSSSAVLAPAAAITPAVKPSGGGGTSGACPSSPNGFLEAGNVDASFTNAGNETTYTFRSLTNEHPVGGVPGLIKYCVYTDASKAPKAAATAKGDDGEFWLARTSKGSGNVSFVRPNGNKSNVGLDGTEETVGTATWGELPKTQEILLHVNDRAECRNIYGAEAPETCFVLPKTLVCDAAGSTLFAYNALPADFLRGCPGPPSHAFEAQQTNEFGDEVTLDGSGKIESMTVDFQSYACENGAWNKGESDPCETNGPEGFTIPASGTDPAGITAHIYEVEAGGKVGKQIGLATNNEPIPYRPSADKEKCSGGADGEQQNDSMWFNNVTGTCVRSRTVLIPFDFSAGLEGEVPADGKVIWTVTFNTTHYGYNPIGEAAKCFTEDGGCGYDSLNVGTKSYAPDAFAGEDVNSDGVFITRTPGTLGEELGWTGYRPLAQITTEK